MMALWIMILLMVIAFSFTTLTRTETLSSVAYRQDTGRKFLAEAGIERGVMEIIFRNMHRNQSVILEGLEAWKTDGNPETVGIGAGEVTVRIMDEAGKVDINRTPEVILRNLLLNLAVTPEDADIIADSIMDWRDADDLHRLHGAENEYYMSLPIPYKSKNAAFETVEELLFVRGVTPAILYGDGTRKGIMDFLTVQSGSDRININAAPREVLLAVGISPEHAEAVIRDRKVRSLVNVQEAGLPAEFAQCCTTGDGSAFVIEAVGHGPGEKKGYAVRATVTLDDNKIYRYLSYRSPAEVTYE